MGEVMKKFPFACAHALLIAMTGGGGGIFALPVHAVTFPSLTTIYVGTGVTDDGGLASSGVATVFHCSNVSGITASIRFLVLNNAGNSVGDLTLPVEHGVTQSVATHFTAAYASVSLDLDFNINQGVVNIESTQSAVFCSAETINAATAAPVGVPRPLVRVNPHPGTAE
jgi:hypothetical protein